MAYLGYLSTFDPIVKLAASLTDMSEASLEKLGTEIVARKKDRHPEESEDNDTYPQRFAFLRLQGSLVRVNQMLDEAREQAAPVRLVEILDRLRVDIEEALKLAPRPYPDADPAPPREERGEHKVAWAREARSFSYLRVEDLDDEGPSSVDEAAATPDESKPEP